MSFLCKCIDEFVTKPYNKSKEIHKKKDRIHKIMEELNITVQFMNIVGWKKEEIESAFIIKIN
ncbi:hypothetical protein AP3564_04660 [Aeribacillus pallidus]|uniref:Uncharacterized protein n=1 Tax=Aeribacillus pallidus TaxID=33936 RepID=A0A223E335_9BACI|nr:hypothetical protein AP3564_04660 [Aeribacillus pallidus]